MAYWLSVSVAGYVSMFVDVLVALDVGMISYGALAFLALMVALLCIHLLFHLAGLHYLHHSL
jgi:hypothetical protein